MPGPLETSTAGAWNLNNVARHFKTGLVSDSPEGARIRMMKTSIKKKKKSQKLNTKTIPEIRVFKTILFALSLFPFGPSSAHAAFPNDGILTIHGTIQSQAASPGTIFYQDGKPILANAPPRKGSTYCGLYYLASPTLRGKTIKIEKDPNSDHERTLTELEGQGRRAYEGGNLVAVVLQLDSDQAEGGPLFSLYCKTTVAVARGQGSYKSVKLTEATVKKAFGSALTFESQPGGDDDGNVQSLSFPGSGFNPADVIPASSAGLK